MGTFTVVMIMFMAIVLGAVLYFITIYNGLVSLKHEVDRAWANIDVLLKQRHDEIPKLIATAEAYMKYEQATLEKVIQARNRYVSGQPVQESAKANAAIHQALGSFFALAENYPDLKANQNFIQFQNRVSALEDSIADRREFYNASVNRYNIRIEQLPDVILAQMLNYKAKTLFQVAESDKTDPKVSFSLPA